MQIIKLIIFIFFLLVHNISHAIEKTIVCTLNEKNITDKKIEIFLDTNKQIVKTREYGKVKWNQTQDLLIKNNGYVWASPHSNLKGIDIQAVTEDLKKFYSDGYDIKLNRDDFSRWLLMNNYTEDDAIKEPTIITKYIFSLINNNNKIENASFDWNCLLLK